MKLRILFLSSLVLLLGSCSPANISGGRALQPPAENIQSKLDLALQQQNYQKAIRLLRTEQAREHSQRFDDAWAQALNGLISLAERHLNDKEYAEAGYLYREVVTDLSKSGIRVATLEMDQLQLKSRIDNCADHLLALGLLAYRHGDLRQAVTIWNKISGFHPQHEASQRALSTTRLQLQNLETSPISEKSRTQPVPDF